MQCLDPRRREPLHDTAASRRIEQAAAAALPPHTLMQRAGLATARLALALAPHARTVWIACGPGNNGGDGLEAAARLKDWGLDPIVTWLGDADGAPPDARASWQRAVAAGVRFAPGAPAKLGRQDLVIDALLGLGANRAPQGRVLELVQQLDACCATRLAVDLPSALHADSGAINVHVAIDHVATNPIQERGDGHFDADFSPSARHTLSLLTLKPGQFTAHGRDACGTLWFDDLGAGAARAAEPPSAWLTGAPPVAPRPHASHKGSYGDVAVVGGETLAARGMGMTGAAILAATAALYGGAGRVLLSLLGGESSASDGEATAIAVPPELMLRRFERLELDALTVVCGCGGGEAVTSALPAVLAKAPRAVLDADALNALAADPALLAALNGRAARGQATVLTPHPLEAARLLACTSADVQRDRLAAARTLAERHGATVVLKGSGTVIAAPGQTPCINPTGNARLATAGTGDVLAGAIGAELARAAAPLAAACHAVWRHGACADAWPEGEALVASALARRMAGC